MGCRGVLPDSWRIYEWKVNGTIFRGDWCPVAITITRRCAIVTHSPNAPLLGHKTPRVSATQLRRSSFLHFVAIFLHRPFSSQPLFFRTFVLHPLCSSPPLFFLRTSLTDKYVPSHCCNRPRRLVLLVWHSRRADPRSRSYRCT